MRKHNGQFRSTKYHVWLGIAWLILIITLLIMGSHVKLEYEYKIISPLPDNPVQQVEAKEIEVKVTAKELITWDKIAIMIISEFKDLGPKVTQEALKIAYCESKWNEQAYNGSNTNGSNDAGVFQLNSIHKLDDSIRFDGLANIKWAKAKYVRDGNWSAWSCSRI